MRVNEVPRYFVQLVAGAAVVCGILLISQAFSRVLIQDSDTVVLVEVGNFEAPVALVSWPGTRDLLLAERAGRVHRIGISSDGSFMPIGQVLDISDRVSAVLHGGLLGLAVSPIGDELYVSYTDWNSQVRILAYRMDVSGPVVDSQRLLLAVTQPHVRDGTGLWWHVGGHLIVDPVGQLIVGLGDGSVPGLIPDTHGNSRNLMTLMGNLLRIIPKVDGVSAYGIPKDNPFVDQESVGTRPEILAYGLRNPWRFDLDPATGDLWIADVGRTQIEEVNYLPAADVESGADFGWVAMEGSEVLNGPEPDGDVLPVHEYRRSNKGFDSRCAVIGGVVVRGGHYPDLEGAFLFSDFCDGVIRALVSDGKGGWVVRDLGGSMELPVSFTRSEDGSVYVLSLAGGVYRLE